MATMNGLLHAYNEVGLWPGLLADDVTLDAWVRVLGDVDDALIEPALIAHARSSKWPPAPSDIVQWVGQQVAGQWPTAGVVYERLAEHAAAVRDHLVSPSLNPRPEALHPDLDAVYKACGGRRALLDANQAAARANVREVLRVMAEQATREFTALGGASSVRPVAGLAVGDTTRQLPPAMHGGQTR